MNAMKGTKRKNQMKDAELESRERAFTPNWGKALSTVEGLPIKVAGKIVATTRQVRDIEILDTENENEDENEAQDEPITEEAVQADEDFEDFNKLIKDDTETEESIQREKISIQKKQSETVSKAKERLATICTVVTTDPESAVRKRKRGESNEDDGLLKIWDLFEYFNHPNLEVVELAILSSALVFKDILPGYKIRAGADSDGGDGSVKLKKETQKLKEYEKSLLLAYQRFLKFLESKILGLGNSKKDIKSWTNEALLGLSALRAECELLRAVPHFNFRSILLKSIATRACQPCPKVAGLCCDTIRVMFPKDVDGELSLELIRELAAAMVAANFQVSETLIASLELVKVRVHADAAKDIRKKAKMERRKRRRIGDDVEAGLMEAGGVNASTVQRNQADALHELIIIYFRLIKRKIGFSLLPVALRGLGRITHLINMDTVEDLISVLRQLIEANSPPAPPSVKLHCVYCVLKTLSGPGQELNIDDDVFVSALCTLILDSSELMEKEWQIILECLEFVLVKKRESRMTVVKNVIKCCFVVLPHLNCNAMATTLALLHTILLRYPQARSDLCASATLVVQSNNSKVKNGGKVEHQMVIVEDVVADMAMAALRKDQAQSIDGVQASVADGGHSMAGVEGDGSWILTLLKHHVEGKVRSAASLVTSREIIPVPYRSNDVVDDRIFHLDESFKRIPQSLPHHATVIGNKKSPSQTKVDSSHKSANQRNLKKSKK